MFKQLPRYVRYLVWALGALAAFIAILGIAWDAVGITKPAITAYCDASGFVERTHASFGECQDSLRADINKYGHVCGCRRSDGIFGAFSKVAQWVL
ncbi:MAG TPA: hypothetical protein VIG57_19625 [Candidatus Entotheonella sp.]|jgi:hypothetical protein